MSLAVITGAGSGIGREFARQLSVRGYALILIARSREKLEETAALCRTKTEIVCADLSKEDVCRKLVAMLGKKEVSVFVNNAGFGNIGLFDECDLDRDLEMIDVNVRAVHILTHGVLRQMKRRNRGIIVNTASVAGLMPGGPLMATYYATKAYVVSLTGAIATELRKSKSRVRIHALCPGPVDTGFNDVAGVRFAFPGISAGDCVSECLSQMKKGRTIIVPGANIRAGAFLAKIAPRAFTMKILMDGQRRKTER